MTRVPILAFTQGDPAGIGPEILLRLVTDSPAQNAYRPLLIAERAALEALRPSLPEVPWDRLRFIERASATEVELDDDTIAVLEPTAEQAGAEQAKQRTVVPGQPTAADARGALAALDTGIELAASGVCQALITAPLNKATIAEHVAPKFRGHTDYLATAAGLETYGRDYLMSFLAPDLRVALLSTHISLVDAIRHIDRSSVLAALRCLARHTNGSIAVAGLNPHASEGGLMGDEELAEIGPAIAAARQEGIDARGPESPDSLFARARQGEFDWVLALYHDQGLIAVKTAAFGSATNLTLGLPYLRTSVDHGTAYDIAGQGRADTGSLAAVVRQTTGLLALDERRI
nr:4-hydroxythreonine-4-phosphate dehydrogenase-like [Nerophis lumbriciformis]